MISLQDVEATSTPPMVLATSGNQYFLTTDSLMPTAPNPKRLSGIQLSALNLMKRGDLELTGRGQYALVEDGDIHEDLTVRKPVLKALAEKGLVEFKELKDRLIYRITKEGRVATDPDSVWQRPLLAPGRQPKERPKLVPKPKSGRKGYVIYTVRHPFARGRFFVSPNDAKAYARRIQAGYALKNEEVPDLIIDHLRYSPFSQKLLVRVLNGETDDDDIVERWESLVPAHSNMKTYQRYEAITK